MSGNILIEPEITTRSAVRLNPRVRTLLGAATLLVPVVGICALRLNSVVGLAGDDAWYVMLAQSLATGHGYQLLNSPLSGILPSYPPAFPFLLAMGMRCWPLVVENLWLLKVVSVAAMLGVGAATWAYTKRFLQLPALMSLTVTLAVVWMPAFVFLATATLMSECVFTLAQLLTVVVVEKALRKGSSQTIWHWWVGAALLGSWSFLTRSIAVSLLGAVVLYLLKERRYQAAVLFTGSTLLCIAPWMVYTRVHATSAELKRVHGGNIVYSYGDQLWMQRAGVSNSGTTTVRDLPLRVWQNTVNIATRDFCGMLFPSLLRSPHESGEESFSLGEADTLGGGNMKGIPTTAALSTSLCLLALLGFVVSVRQRVTLSEILLPCSLAVIVLWPWWTFRFVLPLAPFLLYYIVVGLKTIAQSAQKFWPQISDVWAAPRMFLLCVLALFAYDHVGYLNSQMQNPESSGWISEHHEAMEVLAWLRANVPTETVIASSSPARVFLYAGHKGVSCDDPLGNQEAWQRLGVRYLVVLSSHGVTALDGNKDRYPVIFRTANDMRVIDLRPPAQRLTATR